MAILAIDLDFDMLRCHNTGMITCHYAGRISPRRGWQMPMHQHPHYHEIILVARGQLRVELSGKTLVGKAGTALLYPRNEPHAECAIGKQLLETFYFAFNDPDLDLSNWPRIFPDRSGHVLHATRWLAEVFNTGNSEDCTHAIKLVEVILMGLRQQVATQTPIARVIRHIHYHLSEPITLDDLADIAYMSRFHFARTFQQETGQSPMQYLCMRRVEAARHFLTTSNLPLRSIAPQVGLVDQANLSRVFKRMTGLTPSQAREANS